jgi:hypothetical protein
MKTKIHAPNEREQRIIETAQVRPIYPQEQERCDRLLQKHHYLGAMRPVGERMYYVVTTPCGGWLAVLLFCAAAKHLRHRERWIGWTEEQRRRRLGLVVNNARFLILPGKNIPNLASRVLRLTLDRLSADWEARYGHPVVLVETFVDPACFSGTIYRASGWVELGQTSGFGRCGRDYYVQHNRPKRLFVKELYHNARRSLQAEHLKPSLAVVEEKVAPRCTQKPQELRPLVEHFRKVSDFRGRIESYPVWSLLAIVALAHFCGAPRGQKDLAAFAKRMTDGQRHALGIRRNRKTGKYPSPSQPTFCRLLRGVDPLQVEEAILAFQRQMRGAPGREEVVAMDGKELRHSRGQQLLTAVNVPSQYYLASVPVAEKSNEIPAARELTGKLDLEGRLVGLDALHTQVETARELVQEAGADYLLTVKNNQKGLRRTVKKLLAAAPAAFSPSGDGTNGRDKPQAPGGSPDSDAGCYPGTSLLSGSEPGRRTQSADRSTSAGDSLSADQSGTGADECRAVAEVSTPVLGH